MYELQATNKLQCLRRMWLVSPFGGRLLVLVPGNYYEVPHKKIDRSINMYHATRWICEAIRQARSPPRRANGAHIRQTRPHTGLNSKVKVLKRLKFFTFRWRAVTQKVRKNTES